MVGEAGAIAFAERLLSVVSIAPIPLGTGSIAVTMSAGIVAYPDGEPDRHKLISGAEAALLARSGVRRKPGRRRLRFPERFFS